MINLLGKNIKEARINKKISQKQLANDTGLSTSYIQQLELGQKNNPSLEVKIKIAKALDVEIEDLDPDTPIWDIFDATMDLEKLKRDVERIQEKEHDEEIKIIDYLKKASIDQLIQELNSRNDFPIKIEMKK
ncbi:helix-turn-helix domain-containing protein [Clostridium sulfidigenes]|uniref:helix-turn-helix domain-containing protein n=1 Tax=Clostridium sulfidigenes TaxID=318464 RepID=UPI0018DDCC11|nr:helix-turn-helix transcriptional regulator [Clostridium sulfidigenes]